jgi:hypothetical protein
LIENGLVEAREDEKDKLAKALDVKVEEIWSLADDKETIEENKKD